MNKGKESHRCCLLSTIFHTNVEEKERGRFALARDFLKASKLIF